MPRSLLPYLGPCVAALLMVHAAGHGPPPIYARTEFGWAVDVVVEEGDVTTLDDWLADLHSDVHLAAGRLGLGVAALSTGSLALAVHPGIALAYPLAALAPAYFTVVPARRAGARLTSWVALLILLPFALVGGLSLLLSVFLLLLGPGAVLEAFPSLASIAVAFAAVWPSRRT